MRRALALSVTAALVSAGAAHAETWTKIYTSDNGATAYIDTDYTYKDRETYRLVVMWALSSATRGPPPPGKADRVGKVVALDCAKKNLIVIASYRPTIPPDVNDDWRTETPNLAVGAFNEALIAAVCPTANKAPLK